MPVDNIHLIIWFSLAHALVEVNACHVQFASKQINTNKEISSMCNWEMITNKWFYEKFVKHWQTTDVEMVDRVFIWCTCAHFLRARNSDFF